MSSRRQPAPADTSSWGDRVSCVGKAPLPDKRTAKRRAREIRLDNGADLHAYLCSACSFWHLGHEPGRGSGVRHADLTFINRPEEKRP